MQGLRWKQESIDIGSLGRCDVRDRCVDISISVDISNALDICWDPNGAGTIVLWFVRILSLNPHLTTQGLVQFLQCFHSVPLT